MRKHSVLTVIAASLLLALGQNAVACSLGGRQLTVQLEEGGAELGARNARALAEWFVQWRDGLGVESVIVLPRQCGPIESWQKSASSMSLEYLMD